MTYQLLSTSSPRLRSARHSPVCYTQRMFYKTLSEFQSSNGYDIEGRWYPRVTAIVGIKAKPALYHFYASQKSFAAAEAMKNKSAEEGTLVHEIIESPPDSTAHCRCVSDVPHQPHHHPPPDRKQNYQ